MFDSLKARFILIFALAALSAWTLVQRGILLGLDLRGGTHLAIEIADPTNALTQEQRIDAVDRALQIIRTRVDELGVAEPTIQKVGEERIIIELPGATEEDQQRAKDVIQRSAFLAFRIVRPVSELQTTIPRIDRLVAQKYGATTPGATAGEAPAGGLGGIFQSADTAASDTATADSAAAGAAASDTAAAATADTVGSSTPFSSKLVATGTGSEELAVPIEDLPAMERYLADPEVQALLPRGTELVWGFPEPTAAGQPEAYRKLYLLEKREMMTGLYLEDAQAQRDPQFGQPMVTFQLNRRGGRLFERATGEHVGDQMAIVLDNRVFSAPVIQSAIGMNGQIEMNGGPIEEARDLALVLRAGALPAPITIVEERTVGPSLGADSIEKGQIAGVIGILIVIAMIIAYYKLSGVLAVIALGFYVVYLLGILSAIPGAALTFPGIAGIVLSVGMAVDANVLIYERIREELAAGRSVRPAVNEGFKHALPAIIDSNLTTLITSLILFQFGTGPVRGFAVTLGIGIIASMFTAIFVTRTFFMLYLDRRPAATGLSI
jgi:preprotein translocase subunit SecD